MDTNNLTILKNNFNQNHPIEFIYFWGNKNKNDGLIGKQCLSQWYLSSFNVNGIEYPTAEHYMMAEKARLFNDPISEHEIIHSATPKDAQKLGKVIQNFTEKKWQENRFDIVVKGNYEKFTQNSELSEFLVSTENKILVEASPYDKIWGIGMSEKDIRSENPNLWQGLNLLGFALMEVRKKIKNEKTFKMYMR